MNRLNSRAIIMLLAFMLSACGQLRGGSSAPDAKVIKATHTPPAPVSSISIINAKYRPKNVTVKLGTTLTWTNNDDVPQSVTSDAPGVFDSGLLDPGGTFSYTFNQAGVFPYHSTATSSTFGSVTVTP